MSKGLFLSLFFSFMAHALVIGIDASSPSSNLLLSLKSSDSLPASQDGERITVGLKVSSKSLPKTKAASEPQGAKKELPSQSADAAPAVRLDRPTLIGDSAPEYPAIARRKGQVGDVSLVFSIGADGTVINPRIDKSSGHSLLDQSALNFLIGRRYQLPEGLRAASLSEQKLTISYRLD